MPQLMISMCIFQPHLSVRRLALLRQAARSGPHSVKLTGLVMTTAV